MKAMKTSPMSPKSGSAARTRRVQIEVSRPGRNHGPGDDWKVKEVRVSTGPTASDLFAVLAAALKRPKTKNCGLRIGFEEDRDSYSAAMTVSLSMSGQVFATVRSPFLHALWRPMVAFAPETPSKALAQFSKRSIFSGRIGSAYAAETPGARRTTPREAVQVGRGPRLGGLRAGKPRETPQRIGGCKYGGVPTGNRTRVSALKGPRPDRWTMGTQ
jgi:hypothetical protein